jgi:ribonuclease HI
MNLQLYTDGAAGDGRGAVAFYIKQRDQLKYVFAQPVESTTSNRAEYTAIIIGLIQCKLLGADSVDVYTDSELVINQVLGLYSVNSNRDLYLLLKKIIALFDLVRFHHIPGDSNVAHHLAHRAFKEGVTFDRCC